MVTSKSFLTTNVNMNLQANDTLDLNSFQEEWSVFY